MTAVCHVLNKTLFRYAIFVCFYIFYGLFLIFSNTIMNMKMSQFMRILLLVYLVFREIRIEFYKLQIRPFA